MGAAALLAGLAACGLVVGYLVGTLLTPPNRIVGMAMGFGAGVLMAAVAYALVQRTVETARYPWVVGIGVLLGSLAYLVGDRAIERIFSSDGGNDGMSLALGAVLDGIPESLVIGIAVAIGGESMTALVIAAFLANTAESLGATPLMERQHSPAEVGSLWLTIVTASVGAAVIGYWVTRSLSVRADVFFNGFAAGAVLMVLADALIPDAYARAGRVAGLAVVAGFSLAFVLETLGH